MKTQSVRKTPTTTSKKKAKDAPKATTPSTTESAAEEAAAADPDENMKWMNGRTVALVALATLVLARIFVSVRRNGTGSEPQRIDDPADTLQVV